LPPSLQSLAWWDAFERLQQMESHTLAVINSLVS
jgi:hypothetical protein